MRSKLPVCVDELVETVASDVSSGRRVSWGQSGFLGTGEHGFATGGLAGTCPKSYCFVHCVGLCNGCALFDSVYRQIFVSADVARFLV